MTFLERLHELLGKYMPDRLTWSPTVHPIPRGLKEVIEVYGDPEIKPNPIGKGRAKLLVSPAWESKNCKTVSASKIPGYHRRIYMHRLVAPHFIEAMRRAVKACPEYQFRKIGCFNPRHQRYNRDLPPSDHTWAIAFDINSDTNCWAPADIMPWEEGWERYSDLPRGVVEAFESVGFEWGGRWRGMRDAMHFSLRKV